MCNKLITVITPVYNTDKYLARCIDSIISQTYTKFELILINDGSKDRSGEICDYYSRLDNRIRVYHTLNNGVSIARNLGISKAIGEYICFVDSDDFINPMYLLDLLNDSKYSVSDSFLTIQNYLVFNKHSTINDKKIENQVVVGKENIIDAYVTNELMSFSAPYSKLYNRKVLIDNNITFPEKIHMAEDAIFVLRYLMNIDNLVLSNKNNYNVFSRENSLSNTFSDFETELKTLNLWKETFGEFISKSSRFESKIKRDRIIWNNTKDSFRRTISSLFDGEKSYSLNDKIRLLRKIDKEDFMLFKENYKVNSSFKRLDKFLLGNRQFLIYSILRTLYKYM